MNPPLNTGIDAAAGLDATFVCLPESRIFEKRGVVNRMHAIQRVSLFEIDELVPESSEHSGKARLEKTLHVRQITLACALIPKRR